MSFGTDHLRLVHKRLNSKNRALFHKEFWNIRLQPTRKQQKSPHYRFSPSVRRSFQFSRYTLILSTMEPFLSIALYTARGTRQQTAAMSTTATMTGIAGIMNSTPR